MNKKTINALNALNELLHTIKQVQGDDFLLVLRPEGNGSLALKNGGDSDKQYTNILFDNVESIIHQPSKLH